MELFKQLLNELCRLIKMGSLSMIKVNKQKNRIPRRTVLKLATISAGSALLQACAGSKRKSVENTLTPSDTKTSAPIKALHSTPINNEDTGPIDRNYGEIAPLKYSGEDPDRSHQILWDIPGFVSSAGAKIPDPSEKAPVVIVGGGMSGLISGYHLKKYLPIILESADRFGGNSRGESWRGIDYSIGAAYLCAPEEGTPLDKFYKELDIYRRVKSAPEDEPILFNGKMKPYFLKGDTDPAVATQGAILEKYFSDVLNEKNGKVFPELPPTTEAQKKIVKELDAVSFRDHIRKTVLASDTIHPHLDTWLEHYCWSVFGSSYRELSAAVGVNQFAGEFGKILVPPGGNSFVAEQLYSKLKKEIGNDRLRSHAMVFQVKTVDDGVWVTYERDGEVKTILAETVIFACPKYVVRKIFTDLEPGREKAIRRIRYNSYLVANVLLNQKVPDGFYDLYLLADGKVDGKDIQGTAERHRATDAINGSYAHVYGVNATNKSGSSGNNTNHSGVLTLYRAFPYLAGKAQVLSTGSYFKFRKEFIDQVENEILPGLGISKTAVVGLRIARWGHPLPVAQPGMINSGLVESLSKPYKSKVYFANQDNWLNPCIEQAFNEAHHWSGEVEKYLEAKRLEKTKQSIGADVVSKKKEGDSPKNEEPPKDNKKNESKKAE